MGQAGPRSPAAASAVPALDARPAGLRCPRRGRRTPDSEPGHRAGPGTAPFHQPCLAHARGLGAGSTWKSGLGSELWTPPFNRQALTPDNCVHLPRADSLKTKEEKQ